jgi:hypothetical protein
VPPHARHDFFISHATVDREWAEWIAFEIEDEGFRVVIDVWDWEAGANFIVEMDKATRTADKTLLVLTDDYLSGVYTQPEWAAVLASDPSSEARRLVPVRVAPCRPTGLLSPILFIDLVGLGSAEAAVRLRREIRGGRRKPDDPPAFPGAGQ